jgi:kynurenine formamidase
MKIVDLSQPLYDGMEVYPGDPEVHIKQIHNLDKEGWRLKYLQFSTHIGTHADALSHMSDKGKTIDSMPIDKFIGKTVLVKTTDKFPKGVGLAFRDEMLGLDLFEKIKNAQPRFVVVGDKCDFKLEMERKLLTSGILTMAGLVNMDKLPKNKPFMFYGVPLKIKDGDGSPIRAFAVLE